MTSPSPPLLITLIRQRYTDFGGAERFAQQALTALAANTTTRITLLTRHWNQPPAGFDVVTRNPFHIGRAWRDWSFSRATCRWVEEHPTALIQSHERIPCCDVYRAGDGVHREWLTQRARMGGWSTLAAWTPYHRYVLAAEARLFASPRLKAVICNSHMVQKEIQHHFGLNPERLPVIHNGVDHDRFNPDTARTDRDALRRQWEIPPGATLFVLVGSGYPRKGVPQALHALAALPRETMLAVVGRERRMATFQRLAQRLGVAERVRFAGPQREVLPWYGAADAAVLPTLYDPFPNVALEAMACGLPLATSFKCGAAEMIRHGENGLLADALDTNQLTRNLETLLDPERRRSMGEAGRATVLPLTYPRMAEKLVALYRRLLDPAAPAEV